MQRWVTLDVVKGLGLIFMTASHTLTWWFVYPKTRLTIDTNSWFDTMFLIFGVGVISLAFAAGSSLSFSWKNFFSVSGNFIADRQGLLLKKIVVRSILLLGIGTSVNFLVWGSEALWYWNILQFVALAQVVLYLILRFLGEKFLLICSGLSLASSVFTTQLEIVGSTGFLGAIFFGDSDSYHIWPLIPWFFVISFGFLVGKYHAFLAVSKIKTRLFFGSVSLLVVCSLLGVFSLPIGRTFADVWDYAVYPPTLLLLTAASFYIFSLVTLDHLQHDTQPCTILAFLGRNITVLYLLQLFVGFTYFANEHIVNQVSLSYLYFGVLMQVLTFAFFGIFACLYKVKSTHGN